MMNNTLRKLVLVLMLGIVAGIMLLGVHTGAHPGAINPQPLPPILRTHL